MRQFSVIFCTLATTFFVIAGAVDPNNLDPKARKTTRSESRTQPNLWSKLGPDIAQDVLVRAGKTLQRQQLQAQKKLDSVIASKKEEDLRSKQERSMALFSPSFLNVDVVSKRAEEAARSANKHLKVENRARVPVRDRGKDIENIGMVNKFLHKKMKEQFPPVKNPNAPRRNQELHAVKIIRRPSDSGATSKRSTKLP